MRRYLVVSLPRQVGGSPLHSPTRPTSSQTRLDWPTTSYPRSHMYMAIEPRSPSPRICTEPNAGGTRVGHLIRDAVGGEGDEGGRKREREEEAIHV